MERQLFWHRVQQKAMSWRLLLICPVVFQMVIPRQRLIGGGAGQVAGTTAGGAGTLGQGFAGGSQNGDNGGAGGGGASEVGESAADTDKAGDGGDGLNWQSLGTFYAGGGGGGWWNSSGRGLGGAGGGGAGSSNNGNTGVTAGTANTGGGGGGGSGSSQASANGGSGIVIIRYLGAQRGTGGTVTFILAATPITPSHPPVRTRHKEQQ
jgi:hypothetical protein